MPEISVIIPTWNRRLLLLEAVESVRAQSFTDWELLVVDDGSDDASAEAVSALADRRIRVHSLPHCGSVATLRNAGATHARGQWLAFLDSDDTWLPEKLAAQWGALQRTPARWSCTASELMGADGRPMPFRAGTGLVRSGDILPGLLDMSLNVTVCSVVVERALFLQMGGFRSDLAREDYDFLLRLAAVAPVAAVAEPLVRVREHAARGSASLPSPHEATAQVLERFLEREPGGTLGRLARRQAARELLAGARVARLHAQPALAWRLWRRSLRHRPDVVSCLRVLLSLALRRGTRI